MQQQFDEAYRLVALRLAQAREMQEYQSVVFSNAWPGEGTTTLVTQVARQLQTTFGLKPLIARLRPDPPRSRWWLPWRKSKRRQAGQNSENGRGGTVVVLPEDNAADRAGVVGPFLKKACQLVPDQFDFLLVDAPALMVSGEAFQAAAIIPRMVLVVESGRTQTETLDQIKSQLAAFHITLIGTVLRQHRNPIPRWMEKWLTQ